MTRLACTWTRGGVFRANTTYDFFTPEDVMKVFAFLGFRVEEAVDDEGEDPPPVIRCRKRGAYTLVEFEERVGDDNLFRRLRFSANLELPEEERRRMKDRADAPEGAEPVATVSVVHSFGGGVSLEWLMERIREWDEVLAENRQEVRRAVKAAADNRPTVH